jgi:hypothetical protein
MVQIKYPYKIDWAKLRLYLGFLLEWENARLSHSILGAWDAQKKLKELRPLYQIIKDAPDSELETRNSEDILFASKIYKIHQKMEESHFME